MPFKEYNAGITCDNSLGEVLVGLGQVSLPGGAGYRVKAEHEHVIAAKQRESNVNQMGNNCILAILDVPEYGC